MTSPLLKTAIALLLDAAYAACAYFIKYNNDLHGIIGPDTGEEIALKV